MTIQLQRKDILFPELSYTIVGVLYDVHGKLGNRFQEKYYQRAIAALFDQRGVHYRQQVPVRIQMEGVPIGRYFVDFLIEDEVVLEIKTVPRLVIKDHYQVDAYLKALGKELGILANFRTP